MSLPSPSRSPVTEWTSAAAIEHSVEGIADYGGDCTLGYPGPASRTQRDRTDALDRCGIDPTAPSANLIGGDMQRSGRFINGDAIGQYRLGLKRRSVERRGRTGGSVEVSLLFVGN